MDREPDEMHFLGLFGIYLESYKIIISCRKILSQITLALILPLSFIYLARIEINKLLFSELSHNKFELYASPLSKVDHNKIVHLISSERAMLRIFNFFYLTFSLVFSLLSTSAVVYTIASVYTAREVNFKKVTSVVPKVWKRLAVTFLCAFVVFLFYNTLSIIIFIIWAFTLGSTNAAVPTMVIVLVSYVVGFIYLAIIWQLASVLSVLEDFYGFKALIKSKELIKGKTWIAMVIILKSVLSTVFIILLFEVMVVHGQSHNLISRIGIGFICLLSFCKLILFSLVAHTVIYFVCKSYHHENIDKSMLSDHLNVYLGDYIPLKANDIQLEQVYVL